MRALLFLFLLTSFHLYAQENCANGIDDDNDGQIDINDSECACAGASSNLIPNPSFELMNYCPSTFSQMSGAQTWIQASDATSDYFNTCGYLPPMNSPWFSLPPASPAGNGYVGFYNIAGWKEYVGACLNGTMLTGNTYTLALFLGFGAADYSGWPGAESPSPFELTIYGNVSCGNLPFSGSDCPLNSPTPGWVQIGTVTASGANQWLPVTISITPTQNINAIVIGSNCVQGGNEPYDYYYVDGLSLVELAAQATIQSGAPCMGNLVLQSNIVAGATYQWYRNGVAIIGATGTTYTVPANDQADFRVRIVDGITCAISSPVTSTLTPASPPTISVTGNQPICPGMGNVILTAPAGYSYYSWSNNSNASSITVNSAGTYSLYVENGGPLCNNTANTVITEYNALASSPDVDICAGETTPLSVSSNLPLPPPASCTANPTAACTGANTIYTPTIGPSSVQYPYLGYWHDGRTQMMFTAAELNAMGITAGQISAIALNINSVGSSLGYNISVEMGCTAQSDFNSGLFQSISSVYNSYILPSMGWNTYTFPTPYQWDGLSNLIIGICFDNFDYTWYDYVSATTTAYNSAVYTYSDNAVGCLFASGVATNLRPDIRFTHCPINTATALTYAWTPSGSLSSPNTATTNASPLTTTNYSVTVSNGACSITSNLQVLVSCILPVDLLRFEGKWAAKESHNLYSSLKWETENELNLASYQLERRYAHQTDFTPIATIPATNAPVYQYEDKDIEAYNDAYHVFYRLRSIDINGADALSGDIVELTMLDNELWNYNIYPNPVKDKLIIALNNSQADASILAFEIFDVTGKQIKDLPLEIKDNKIIIQVDMLASGSYLLKTLGNEVKTHKFVKE